MKTAYLLIATFVVLTFACGKKLDIGSYRSCHLSQSLDSAETASKLLGSWKWTKRDCMDANRSSPANENVRVVFSDSVFSVYRDTAKITTGSWTLEPVETNVYRFRLEPQSLYLHGNIFFCNEEVLFNDSDRDGCDYVFIKN